MRSFPCMLVSLTLFAGTVIPVSGAPAGAPADRFRSAELHELEPPQDLLAAFRDLARRDPGPAWVSYTVPRIPSLALHDGTRHDGGCGTYYLEDREWEDRHSRGGGDAGDAFVLLRVAEGEIVRIAIADVECTVDAGGRPVYLFGDVNPLHSLDLLATVTAGAERRGLVHGALHAVAAHDDPAADALLERAARGDLGRGAEEQAVFWLGAARGERGLDALRRLAGDEDPRLREHVTFALHVSAAPEAIDVLTGMARHDSHPRVRRQALFWLGQEAGRRAVAELERAAEEDPELGVKKHAIFAISQLPADEGVPLLIRYARTHPHSAVRRQAMFWLGQSDDARALDFFEEVLRDPSP